MTSWLAWLLIPLGLILVWRLVLPSPPAARRHAAAGW